MTIGKLLNFTFRLRDFFLRFIMSGVDYARFKGVSVGHSCRIYTYGFGTEPWLIRIGNKVTITSGVILLTHDGSTWLINDEKGRRYLYRRITIEDNVFIGVNSIIMPGVIISKNVIVAAGSVVTKSVPTGVIVAGNPAMIIGDFDTYKKKAQKDFVSDSDIDFSESYRNRIDKIADNSTKKYLL
jgi:acetyltransferase-like isoleucine patch superfamily enzyme